MDFLRLIMSLTLVVSLSATAETPQESNVDPLEAINRPLFVINNQFDRFLLRPLAKGYDVVMPGAAKRGVGNLFANMYDANAAVNAVLQWRLEGAAQGSSRFLINSTVGLVGLFDVATKMGIRPYRTDFGHTLAIWGFESGPYLMVPLFGPRTFRSGTGTIFDTYTSIPAYIASVPLRNTLWGMELVHGRSTLLSSDELISGDRYIFIRDAYLQYRDVFVNDGVIEDSFSDFEEGDEWEDF